MNSTPAASKARPDRLLSLLRPTHSTLPYLQTDSDFVGFIVGEKNAGLLENLLYLEDCALFEPSQRSLSGFFSTRTASSTILLIASAREGTSIWPRRQSSTMRKKDSDTRI
jgi:hypothetical protein